MPHLDFMTLYILIFLNSLTVTAIWAGFAYTYRPHAAAQHWLVATSLTLIGGIILSLQGNGSSPTPAIVGNAIIILGFSQFWIGLRRLHGQRGGQAVAVAFALVAAAAMVAMYDNDRGRAITYATGQSIVMLTCLVHLLRNRQPGIGTIISAAAFAIAMLGQITVVASNIAVLTDALEYEVYYALASYALLCTVFAAAIWNLGFAMQAIDSLYQKVTRLSQTDDLTGLANRRAFRTALEDMQSRALGGVYAYSVVLIDLNDFKPLNDRFGHAAGDAALQHFAQLLRASTRKGDVVARLGGDEFCILLPDSTASDARTVADVIRHKTGTESLLLPEASVRLSASIGVASTPEDGPVDLVALADTRLYRDKQQNGGQGRSEHSRLQLVKNR